MLVVQVLFMIVLLGNTSKTRAYKHISGIVANGKPILRSIPQDSPRESQSKISSNTHGTKEPDWLKQLRKNIFFALNGYGFEEAKTYIQQLVEDAEKTYNTLLHVKVSQDGVQSIQYKPAMRQGFAEPHWLSDFKTYVHQLVSTHGPHNIDTRLSSVINFIQKNNDVLINDVDVDDKGEVNVDYTFIRKYKKITTEAREPKNFRRPKNKQNDHPATVIPVESDSE